MLVEMQMAIVLLVVVSANVLGAAMAVPQARRLLRERSAAGVSVVWAGASVTVNAWWIPYGVGVGDLGIVPVSAVSVMSYLVIVVAIGRFSLRSTWATFRPAAATAVGLSAVPTIVLLTAGWAATGVVLGALYGVQLAPAVVAVYRSVDVSGVSPATWLIAFVEAGLWGGYGAMVVDVGLLALSATGVAMSSLVLARLFVRRPRRRPGRATTGTIAWAPA